MVQRREQDALKDSASANTIGVPLDRIIFIGDFKRPPHRVAKQVGMHFTGGRLNASNYGRQLLIHSRGDNENTYYVYNTVGHDLKTTISRIELAAQG